MTCPVLTPCRSHALHGPERFGIWGGTTPTERARL
ncbi:WhiB family transcriptional regulator [Rhodococcus sp. W8901]|nr:WhiB family transcriptional regulator [Rhodococcus sp. W8901]QKT11580.1 WhiB family transcriptional regulator [Rhodococcus sp. W8901]